MSAEGDSLINDLFERETTQIINLSGALTL